MAEAVLKKEVQGPIELIKESLELFFQGKNFVYLLKVTLAMIGIEILPIIATILPIVLLTIMADSGSENGAAFALLVLLAIIGGVISIITFLWAQIVTVYAAQNAIKGTIGPISEVLKKSWSGKIAQLFVLQLLLGLIILGGLILFVIPAIIFGVWFAFALYFLILENKGITESLGASKTLVSGYFWTVLGYNLLYGVITSIVIGILNMVIPFVGSFLVSIMSLYFVIFPLLLYRELKKAKA